MTMEQIDKNFSLPAACTGPDVQAYTVLQPPFTLRVRGVTEECSVDGSHPNDLGFYCMAEALEPVLRAALLSRPSVTK